MTTHFDSVARLLHRATREADTRSDVQLLEQFLHHGDDDAFTLLVQRHGPMVHGVCRRLLGDVHDVEDAFQATFLVLIRKASFIARGDRLGPWLYGVAFRTAQKARFHRRRRQTVERPADPSLPSPSRLDPAPSDWLELLDQELLAMPVKYRLPLVLCELRGVSRRQAARQLDLPEGTLSSRLARGRQLLRQRLLRRGVALSAPALLTGLEGQTRAAVPASLVGVTIRAARRLIANPALPAGVVSTGVLSLMEGVLTTMLLAKLKIVAMILSILAVLGALSFQVVVPIVAAPSDDPPAAAPPPRREAADQAQRPVAIIHGNVPITREELGDFLIARYGAEKVDLLVNHRIIELAGAKKGITVTPREIETALADDIALLNVTRSEFVNRVLKQHGKTLYEWREDVIKPKLQLAKLCRGKITVTEDDMRRMFENRYGAKVRCQFITWPKGEEQIARKLYDEIRHSDESFNRHARAQANPSLAARGGEVPPLARYSSTEDTSIEDEAFQLKPGEVSRFLTAKDGSSVVIKCLGRIPAEEGKDFETEKPFLMKSVIDRKIAQEVPKLFQSLRDGAKPRILLTK